jgi:hypothetical protein
VVEDDESQTVVDFLRATSRSFRRLYNRIAKRKDFTLVIHHRDNQASVADYNPSTKTVTMNWSISQVNQMNMNSLSKPPVPPRAHQFVEDVGSAFAHEVGHAGGYAGILPSACRTDPDPGSGGCSVDFENTVRQEWAASVGLRSVVNRPWY